MALSRTTMPLCHKMAYLLTLLAVAVFSAVCFFKFAVELIWMLATSDVRHAHIYIYGGIMYLIFSIVIIFYVSRCVIEYTFDTFEKIQLIKAEEARLTAQGFDTI